MGQNLNSQALDTTMIRYSTFNSTDWCDADNNFYIDVCTLKLLRNIAFHPVTSNWTFLSSLLELGIHQNSKIYEAHSHYMHEYSGMRQTAGHPKTVFTELMLNERTN